MATEDLTLASFVEGLQQEYGSNCKVLSDLGEFAFLVTFRFSDGVTMKVQLPIAYPTESPVVIGNSEEINKFREQWKVAGFDLHKFQPITKSLFGDRLSAAKVKSVNEGGKKARSPNRQNKEKKHIKAAVETTDAELVEKKPRMKTVEEVVQRIVWDPEVDRQQVFVGYEDRFYGVLEKQFDDFGFDIDIADCDERVPLHRVAYFRYAQRTVWDKRSRLDLVFGSTCEPGQARVTLTDVVRESREVPVNADTQNHNSDPTDYE